MFLDERESLFDENLLLATKIANTPRRVSANQLSPPYINYRSSKTAFNSVEFIVEEGSQNFSDRVINKIDDEGIKLYKLIVQMFDKEKSLRLAIII